MKCQKCGAEVPRAELPNAADRKEFGIFCTACLRASTPPFRPK